jgi:signal transduction histidine kinase
LIPIKKSWQKQQDFVADASHELRTPLAVIQTNIELVRGNPKDSVESQTKWLENIQHETGRMSKLVEDLLFLARADSEQLPLEMMDFNLSFTLLSTLSSFEVMAKNRGIKLESTVQDHILFYGDENRLKQLIVILIDNALKHTPAGGKISIRLINSGPSVELSVSDTGEGIEHEHLERIFERFYRVDKARSKMTGGTGLGLSIADWITKVHHGRITVTSQVGKGTTFVVNLPHGGNKKDKRTEKPYLAS